MPDARILIGVSDWRAAADLRKSLREAAYPNPATAATGEEAFKAAVTLIPDLSIMDIDLKGSLDGIETAALIGQYLDIPIVLVADSFDAMVFERAKSCHPFGWLIKPFSSLQLAATIETALHNLAAIRLRAAGGHLSHRDHGELVREDSWSSPQAKAVIPLCSCCKQVRHAGGRWTQLETYFAEHFGIRFTHSLCPECVKIFRPD